MVVYNDTKSAYAYRARIIGYIEFTPSENARIMKPYQELTRYVDKINQYINTNKEKIFTGFECNKIDIGNTKVSVSNFICFLFLFKDKIKKGQKIYNNQEETLGPEYGNYSQKVDLDTLCINEEVKITYPDKDNILANIDEAIVNLNNLLLLDSKKNGIIYYESYSGIKLNQYKNTRFKDMQRREYGVKLNDATEKIQNYVREYSNEIFADNIICSDIILDNSDVTNYLIFLNILKETILNGGPKITESSSTSLTQIINGEETKTYTAKVFLGAICPKYSYNKYGNKKSSEKGANGGKKTKKHTKKLKGTKKMKKILKRKTQKRRKRTHRRR